MDALAKRISIIIILRYVAHTLNNCTNSIQNFNSLTLFSGRDRVCGVAAGQCRKPGEEAEGPGGLLGHPADPGDGVQPHAPL